VPSAGGASLLTKGKIEFAAVMGLDFAKAHAGEHPNCALTTVDGPVLRYAGNGAADEIYWTLTTTDAEANGGRYTFTLSGYNAAGQRSKPIVQPFLLARHTNPCKSAARQVLGAVQRFDNHLRSVDKYSAAVPATLDSLDRLDYAMKNALFARSQVDTALDLAATPCTGKAQIAFLAKVRRSLTPIDPEILPKLSAYEQTVRQQIADRKPQPALDADRALIARTLTSAESASLKLRTLFADI
jgi:hypothetical protein